MTKTKKTLYCSLCGKSEHEVHKLVVGPGNACDECVAHYSTKLIMREAKKSVESALSREETISLRKWAVGQVRIEDGCETHEPTFAERVHALVALVTTDLPPAPPESSGESH